MTTTLKLSADTWVVRSAVAGPNTYCLSFVFGNTHDPGHISHCACGVMAGSREQAVEIATQQTAEQFPPDEGWYTLGIAISRMMFGDQPAS